MIHCTCSCGKSLQVPDESAGTQIKCPGCGQVAVVPVKVAVGGREQTAALPSTDSQAAAGERPTDPATCDLHATGAWADSAPRQDIPRNDRAAPPQAQGAGDIWSLGGYRIVRELGRGGIGVLYEAEDVALERRVAVKVLKPEIAANQEQCDRFLRQASRAASVESRCICPIYEVGEDNGVPFIAMRFLKGAPLHAHWQKGMRLAIDEVVRIGKDVAEGLSAAHDAGLVHRDIKPANIWLETQPSGPPRALILDFGLARVQADNVQISQSGAIVGTPAYMSPEQARGGKGVDARTDLFSLGCVLYALCTGELPFQGAAMMDVLLALATHDPAPPHSIAPAIPRPLSELILRLLAKNPGDRPPTARAVIEELAAIERTLTTRIEPAAKSGSKTLPSSKDVLAPSALRRKIPYAVYALIAIGVLGCIIPLVGVGIYYVVTDTGTIEILTEDEKVQVVLLKNGQEIEILDGASKKTWSIRSGSYTVCLKDDPDDLEIGMPDTFELKRGGKQIVTIRKLKALPDRLMDADEKHFAALFPKLKDRGEQDLPALTGEVDKKLPPDAKEDAKETLAKRQANAAVALLRMNRPEKVWPLLKHSPDPRVRSYLIHRLGPLGVDAGVIGKQLDKESDLTIRRALVLSLGEFSEKDFTPADRKAYLPKLREMYTAADPGLHAASEWLLRQWKQEAWIAKTNQAWAADKQQQSKSIEEIMHELKKETSKDERRWYVNVQGQMLVVIPGPVEFWMGSPQEEKGRESIPDKYRGMELRHWRRIGRSFAIASKEVTVEQFLRFRKEHPIDGNAAPSSDCPVNMVTWYEAAAYCNWLSEQEGIPRDQWCYEPNKEGNYDLGMKMAADSLQRTGYRLPTEAEWEYACRAGAATSYSFGESDELLPRYAWYQMNGRVRSWPVGSLKPNDLGLFDMHGNVWEWCQDAYKPYAKGGNGKATEDIEDTADITDGDTRVPRGGSFVHGSSFTRSAYRPDWKPFFVPTNRNYDSGFRPARTLPFSSFDRYDAARAAAVAAAGQGKNEPPLGDAAKAKLRRQALDWLKAELTAWSLVQPPRLFVAHTLNHWQQESDLAGIRDAAALAKLPAEEQKAFTQFWADVAKSAEPANSSERLEFARAAALAAAGQRVGAPLLDDAAKAKLRGQALDWLKAELAAWTKLLESGAPQARLTIAIALSAWQKEADLAGIRDPEALARLPRVEQAEWQARWAEVEALVKQFASLPAAKQVEEVRTELMKCNPGFGGSVTHTNERDVVTALKIVGKDVTDVSPVRALVGLKVLSCTEGPLSDLSPLKGLPLTTLDLHSTHVQDLTPLKGMPLVSLDLWFCSQVRDLEPLKGMKLIHLDLNHCQQVQDLEALKGMPLTSLYINDNQVRDLTPLKDMKLTFLVCSGNSVSDLSPLQGMTLQTLLIHGTDISDLKPLQGMPLERIHLTPKNITEGLDILRDMKSLNTIGIGWFDTPTTTWPAAEFWARYDRGEFTK